jgi:hypothetical protein
MNRKTLITTFLAIIFMLPVSGQEKKPKAPKSKAEAPGKSFGLFENDTPLEITLRFNMTSYFKVRSKTNYIPAVITIHLSSTDSVNADVRLRTRGQFRNKECYFAPIELNFKKAKFGYSDLDSISKLKLVTQCNTGVEYQNWILREHLVYKMFNLFTDSSFRVRLLHITYIDTEKKRKPVKHDGFFIEPEKMLAKRLNALEIQTVAVNQKNIVPREMDMVAIFNYMIGNYDWAVPNQHNIRLMKPLKLDTVQLALAIPYDFDWTGVVNPAYAIPAENVGTKTVRERIFTGICRSKEIYSKDLELFIGKKEALYKLINDYPYLNQRSKRDITIYLDGFFDQCKGRKEILDIFLNACKKL